MALVRDEFEPLGELGRGGAGRVYAARHRASGREVAIKALLGELTDDPVARQRLLREGGLRLESPHLVQVFEVRVEGPVVYVIMERVHGASLEERVARAGRLPVDEALGLCEQVALGLEAAHRAGVVHRDVKPGNILVTAAGVAKLGDFGIAKDLNTVASLTASAHGMGTLAYVAPEQAESARRVDGRADLYSLGATLYHLLAGRPPFLPTSPDLVIELFDRPPPPLRDLRPDCPEAVAWLVHKLLEKDPRDRPPTALSVAGQLRRLRG